MENSNQLSKLSKAARTLKYMNFIAEELKKQGEELTKEQKLIRLKAWVEKIKEDYKDVYPYRATYKISDENVDAFRILTIKASIAFEPRIRN